MSQERQVKLLWLEGDQVVEIPAEFEFECDTVLLRKEGDRLTLEPVWRTPILRSRIGRKQRARGKTRAKA